MDGGGGATETSGPSEVERTPSSPLPPVPPPGSAPDGFASAAWSGEAEPAVRRFDVSSVAGLLPAFLLLPVGVVCFLPFAGLIGAVTSLPVSLVVILWLAAAGLMFTPPVEGVLLTRFFGTREPTAAEQEVLTPCWHAVLARANIPMDRYILRVVDSRDLNAAVAGGHLVMVTRHAITALPLKELRAVLAHELGHHLGLHTVGLLLCYWLSVPIVWCSRAGYRMARIAYWFTRVFGAFRFVGATIVGFIIGSMFHLVAFCFRIVTEIADAIGRLIGQSSEYYADRAATDLGFGADLVSALDRFRHLGLEDHSRSATTRALFSTHPPLAQRIVRIQDRVTHRQG